MVLIERSHISLLSRCRSTSSCVKSHDSAIPEGDALQMACISKYLYMDLQAADRTQPSMCQREHLLHPPDRSTCLRGKRRKGFPYLLP